MGYKPRAIEMRLQDVIQAWETLRPNKSFAGMTLAAFKSQLQPSFDARQRLAQLDAETTAALTQRDSVDVTSNEVALLMVNAVKGDPQEGENGELYAAMGYVRKADRRSGLTRRLQSNSPLTTTITKTQN